MKIRMKRLLIKKHSLKFKILEKKKGIFKEKNTIYIQRPKQQIINTKAF